ncbi:hypothetical protein BVC80_1811g34 [Macleaya cordata]|uniref:Uncharacterized protein n=1 Tax=Macleaya cordata TaxID=56857 RepID=A0A200QVR8_MACCD|nr:hypothetical protein BVC80_1811g34 [Macleaya cordata]
MMIPAATLWCVWKERNARAFEDKEEEVDMIICNIKMLAFRWVSKEEAFRGCTLDWVMGR